MSFNKDIFSEHFKNKDYDACSDMLRKELISILVNEIKKINPTYVYTTITFLKSDCFKYLSPIYQDIAIKLYDFSFNEDPSEFELSQMMDIYQFLLKNNEQI